jgi:hypothetical protein
MEEKKTDLRDERQRAWKRRRHIWEIRDREKERGQLRMHLSLGLEENMLFILFFFSSASLVEPGRFGSVQSVSDFGNRNRTESEMIFLINFFLVFSV